MSINKFDMVHIYLPYYTPIIDKSIIQYTIDEQGNIKNEFITTNGISIKANLDKNYTTVRITSKCLGVNMPEFISDKNIEFIHNEVSTKIEIAFQDFMNAAVTKIEVSKDISTPYSPEDVIDCLYKLSKYLKDFIIPKTYYKHNKRPTSGYVKRNNLDPDHIEFLSYYVKLNEYLKKSKAHNSMMLDALSEGEKAKIVEQLQGKIRLELKLNSKTKIEQYFKLKKAGKKPTLLNLLESEESVLRNAFEKIFSKTVFLSKKEGKSKSYNQLSDFYVLEAHDYDLVTIFSILKTSLSTKQSTRIIERMKQAIVDKDINQYCKLEDIYQRILIEL